jgi:type IX secretion system PorP/SprF family membrane protein
MKLLTGNVAKKLPEVFSWAAKIMCVISILSVYSTLQAQNRKHLSSFSLVQQYYNPAFTGFNGSVIKTYYRDQWTGFDGAPKTLFISGEVNLDKFQEKFEPRSEADLPVIAKTGIRHSVGLSFLHDSFGPFVENQIFASYRSLINLSTKVKLQAGAAIAYHAQTLDGSKLTSDEAGDPSLQNYINRMSRSGRMDFNIGLALSGENSYVGYAMQNIRGGLGDAQNDFFKNNSKIEYILQGGCRRSVSDKFGMVLNGLLRFNNQLKETFEAQIKGVFYNMAWLGLGYRNSLAYSLNVGFRVNQWQLGYAYEIPTGDAQMTGSGTNELMVTYDLQKIIHPKLTRQISIW